MKHLTIILISSFLVAGAAAQATADEPATRQAAQPATGQPNMEPTAVMQQRMKEMQALMDKIERTADPKEKQRLLDQHSHAMREQLQSMEHMGGMSGMGMGSGSGSDMGNGMGKGMTECHEQMQAHMKMMSGMMEQLMRHEDAEHGKHD